MAKMSLSTKNLDAVIARVKRYGGEAKARVQVAVEESAERAYQHAQSLCPFLTGRMKRRMRKKFMADGLGYQMGFWAEDFPEGFYPIPSEFGSRRQIAQPCIMPAGEAERPRFRRAIKEAASPRGRRQRVAA